MGAVTVESVLEVLGAAAAVLRRGSASDVTGPAPVAPGEPGALSFCTAEGERAARIVGATLSAVVLVRPATDFDSVGGASWVLAVADPRAAYVKALNVLFPVARATGIHPSAVIAEDAVLGSDCYVGPHASIGRATLGDRCWIGPGAVILDDVVMGDDVVVGPSTTVGFTGFGYARDDDGSPVPFPHYGGVRIGDRVEIGANTAIDRGTLSHTVIEDDAKIDNLVHVAHNCRVRKGAFVIATSILCGGVDVGERAWVAPNASVLEHVTLGADSTVGLAATVISDVEPGTVVVGSPARPLAPRTP